MIPIYMVIATSLIIVDQLTKWLVVHYLDIPLQIAPLLVFHRVINRGISWGIFNDNQNPIVFSLITLVITIITGFCIGYLVNLWRQGESIWGLTLICAGSCSNIIDRLVRGGVVDFIEFSYGSFVWPNFNIADICIVFGVGILLIEQYKKL